MTTTGPEPSWLTTSVSARVVRTTDACEPGSYPTDRHAERVRPDALGVNSRILRPRCSAASRTRRYSAPASFFRSGASSTIVVAAHAGLGEPLGAVQGLEPEPATVAQPAPVDGVAVDPEVAHDLVAGALDDD